MRKLFLFLLTLFFIVGCGKKADRTIPVDKPSPVEETHLITTASGLQYVDLENGQGQPAMKGDLVAVQYTGWLTNGKRFDSSIPRNKPIEFRLGQGRVIPGWEEGILNMKVGGVRQLRIPPELAYGEQGFAGVIPPNATLIFEVKLVDIKK